MVVLHLFATMRYRIAQNSGGVKLWRIDHFRVLARKTLANLQLYISHFSESGIWLGKILANDVLFAKFANVSPARILRYTVRDLTAEWLNKICYDVTTLGHY